MERFFRISLAAIYVATALVVVINRTVAAGDELGRATAPAASQLDSQADVHWASDPHFSHAKKTGSDFEFSTAPLLRFTVTSAGFVQHAFSSDYDTFQNPRAARAPPLFS
jgi:hypothetical protein